MKKLIFTLVSLIIVFVITIYLKIDGNDKINDQKPMSETEKRARQEEMEAVKNTPTFDVTIADFEKSLKKVEFLEFIEKKNIIFFQALDFTVNYRSVDTKSHEKLKVIRVTMNKKIPDLLKNSQFNEDFNLIMKTFFELIDTGNAYDKEKIAKVFTTEPTGDLSQVDIKYSEKIKIYTTMGEEEILTIVIEPNRN